MAILQKCLVLGVFGALGILSLVVIWSHFTIQPTFNKPLNRGKPFPGDTHTNLLHIAQVSDVHISVHHEPERTADFKEFCHRTINELIKPRVLLVTGDLTDAKSANKLYSEQYRKEWDDFVEAVDGLNGTETIAIRGNHDAFNEPNHLNSYYAKYLHEQRNLAAETELFQIQTDFGNYSLVSVDAAPQPGFKRPFNFVGYVGEKSLEKLEELKPKLENGNQTVLFGHYPTSTMFHASEMRDLFASLSLAYLCGHLHNGAGVIPQMQHMHASGVAELELGDWKKNRVFRIMSFDHDLFSFTDHKWSSNGIYAHIANPPEWRLTNPEKQPLDRVANSTHVRVLIFSESEVTLAEVEIDGVKVQLEKVSATLWIAPWTPKESGLVVVNTRNSAGANSTQSHQYKLHYDSFMSSEFSLAATFILSVDFCVYFSAAFWLGTSIPLFFMIIMSKIYSKFTGRQDREILFGYDPYFTHLALPLGLWSLWIMFMPWFVGNMIDIGDSSRFGLVGTFGVYLFGDGLHKQHEVYATAFWDVVTFLWPSYLYTSYFAERLWSSKSVSPLKGVFNCAHFLLIVAILWLRLTALYQITGSYGWSAGVTSPVFLFPVINAVYSSYFIYFKRRSSVPS